MNRGEIVTYWIDSAEVDALAMDRKRDKQLAFQKVREYVQKLRENHIKIWRLYLYGSYAKGTYHTDSDIDLAVFLEKDDLDGFEENVQLMKLRRNIDMRIEPHPFAKSDFDETNPFVKEIIETGERMV